MLNADTNTMSRTLLRCTFSCRPGCNRRFSVVSNMRRHFKVHGRKAAATAASNASACLRPLACSPPTTTSIHQQQQLQKQKQQSLSSSLSTTNNVKSLSPSLSVSNSLESWSFIDPQPVDTDHLKLQHSYGSLQASISTSPSIQTPPATSVIMDRAFMPPASTLFDISIMDYDPPAVSISAPSQTHSLYTGFDSWLSMPLMANLTQPSTAALGWYE